jgi:hypothetical protein
MKREYIEGLVNLWKPRLGLDLWGVDVRFEEFDEAEFAVCHHSAAYNEAIIVFQPWLLTAKKPPEGKNMLDTPITEALVERLVVHELMHLVVRDFTRVLDDHLPDTMNPVDREHLQSAYNNANEAVVDALAVSLTRSFGQKAA